MAVLNADESANFSEFVPFSPFATLQEIYCGKEFGGLGLRYSFENSSVKVAEVFDGSPAEKAGIKVNDIVTQIDSESVVALTPQQVIERSRGAVNTKVVLTIQRPGQDGFHKSNGYPRENSDTTRPTGIPEVSKISLSLVPFLILTLSVALAQTNLPSESGVRMEGQGGTVTAAKTPSSYDVGQFSSDIPTNQISKLAQSPISEAAGIVRSANGQQVYRIVSPSVVLVATKEGFGSGSLVDTAGDIVTNWHVVRGYDYVGLVFKPTAEGKEPTRDEIKRGQVVKYDEISDLALVKAAEVPPGRVPVRLGNASEIAVGEDVHAIGHPTGEAWTYTAGVISQYRKAYEWQAGGDPIAHKADIIQTQTPINPGNSGGPLLSDSASLIGVNSFKAEGEGLNFAVSVDEVRRFIARPGNRVEQTPKSTKSNAGCKPKELSMFRNKANDATVISFDMFCSGQDQDTGELVTPDDQSQAIFLRVDRNGDGRPDVIFFDRRRSGRWDLSFWDDNFSGHWTLVGYHDDGTLKPTRFESYEEFQKRTVSR
jgi:S1-C subfamily serine protease